MKSPTHRPSAKPPRYLRTFGPDQLNSTYAIALQTMVYAAADPERDMLRIAANVNWLETAQIKPGDPVPWPGSWAYSSSKRAQPGDNSNSQYALLGLNAASEAGVPIKPEVWALARAYWEHCQKRDGSWAYTPDSAASTASMTCAGISSLVITGLKRFQGQEFLQGDQINNCGKGVASIEPAARHRLVGQPLPGGSELRQRPAVEALLPLWTGTSRPAGWTAVFRPARLVSAGSRGAGPRAKQAIGVLARRADRGRPDGRHQLRDLVSGQGPRPGAGQQAPPRAPRRLEPRPR